VTKKDLAARRQRNRELGQLDRANRCSWCLKAFEPGMSRFRRFGGLIAFCSEDCLADADAFFERLRGKEI
jgi:hypothetical protein